jgi:hypothetical protein
MRERRRGSLGARRGWGSLLIPLALLGFATLSGQSEAPVNRLRTCHIQGLIRTQNDSVVPNGNVTFRGKGNNFIQTVFADDTGFYESDLAAGLYTMTAEYLKPAALFAPVGKAQEPGLRNLQAYERPLFRIASQTSLTLNITLDPPYPNCERGYGVGPSASSPPPYDGELFCGGQDVFPIPSVDNVPFELLVRFSGRQSNERGYIYNPRGSGVPVFAAYNLFTLRADSVIYEVQNKTLRASGHVVAVGYDGATQGAPSMNFKLENGKASPLAD